MAGTHRIGNKRRQDIEHRHKWKWQIEDVKNKGHKSYWMGLFPWTDGTVGGQSLFWDSKTGSEVDIKRTRRRDESINAFLSLWQSFPWQRTRSLSPPPPPLIDVLVLTDTVCAGLAHISAQSFSCSGYLAFLTRLKARPLEKPPPP